MLKIIAASFSVLVLMLPSAAVGEIITDRPDVAESSRTVGQTRLQIEAGVDTTEFSVVTFPTKVRFGLIDPLELHVESGIVTISDAGTSASDVDVGGKVHLLEAGRLSTGLLTAVTIPVAGEAVLLRPTAALDIDLGRFGIGLNLGADIPLSARDTVSDTLRFAAALGVGIVGGLGAFAEVFGAAPFTGDFVLSFDGGFSHAINETNQLDLYVRVDDVANSAVLGAGAGYAVKF